MLRLAVVASIFSFFIHTFASVTDCSNGASLFKLSSMSFSPDPTIPGQNSTLLLSIDVPEQFNDLAATATYSTTYNFIPFTPTVDTLCDVTIPCPIKVGILDTYSTFPIDPTLSGTLQLKIEWKDSVRQLLCVLIKTKLGTNAV